MKTLGKETLLFVLPVALTPTTSGKLASTQESWKGVTDKLCYL